MKIVRSEASGSKGVRCYLSCKEEQARGAAAASLYSGSLIRGETRGAIRGRMSGSGSEDELKGPRFPSLLTRAAPVGCVSDWPWPPSAAQTPTAGPGSKGRAAHGGHAGHAGHAAMQPGVPASDDCPPLSVTGTTAAHHRGTPASFVVPRGGGARRVRGQGRPDLSCALACPPPSAAPNQIMVLSAFVARDLWAALALHPRIPALGQWQSSTLDQGQSLVQRSRGGGGGAPGK